MTVPANSGSPQHPHDEARDVSGNDSRQNSITMSVLDNVEYPMDTDDTNINVSPLSCPSPNVIHNSMSVHIHNQHMTPLTNSTSVPSSWNTSLDIVNELQPTLDAWKERGMPHEDEVEKCEPHRSVWTRPEEAVTKGVEIQAKNLLQSVISERKTLGCGHLIAPLFNRLEPLHQAVTQENIGDLTLVDCYLMNTETTTVPKEGQLEDEAFHRHADECHVTIIINMNTQSQGQGGQLQVQSPEWSEMNKHGVHQDNFHSLDGDKGSFAVFTCGTPHFVRACQKSSHGQPQVETTILLIIMMDFMAKTVESRVTL